MIYEEIAAGRLIARKIGRRTIVRRSDALLWLRSLPPLDPTEGNGARNPRAGANCSSGQLLSSPDGEVGVVRVALSAPMPF